MGTPCPSAYTRVCNGINLEFPQTNVVADGVKQLCIVKSNLTGVKNSELIKKRMEKRLFLKGKKYYLCTFEVKAIIGPADLRFELWFGGQRFSGNHEPLKITWDSEGAKVGR